MTTQNATKNGAQPRQTLAGQIDRLDTILDGLAEALNESVADAVKRAMGEALREAVADAVREVLDDPELVRAAVARHAKGDARPDEAQPQRTLAGALGDAVGWVVALAAPPVLYSGKALSWAWTWCLQKVRGTLCPAYASASAALAGLAWLCGVAWQSRWACATAIGVGTTVGVVAYACGPTIASMLAALGSAALCLVGSAMAGLVHALGGEQSA
jgi:hypothetical protein